MNILRPNPKHAAISRGIATFILAAAIYGVIIMFFFPGPAAGEESDRFGEKLKGIIVISTAALTGLAEVRRYLKAEHMKE